MSEPTRKRRQFLADLLFAGGAAVSAALLARAMEPEPEPVPPPPRTQPAMHRRPSRPEPPVNGGMVMRPPVQPVAEGRFEIAHPQTPQTPGSSR
ncbi:MAG: hypothetical protein AMXMBFR33_25320 [Candidatus Xenobia bacterium]